MVPDFDASPYDPVGPAVAAQVRARLEPRCDEMADLLGEMVRIESPTDDPPGLHRMADLIERLFSPFGPIAVHPIGPGGSRHLELTVPGSAPELAHVVTVCHYDTVWPVGTLATMPFAIAEGRATGPGSFDMKGGILLLYYALRELAGLGMRPHRTVRALFTADEEVRSETSRGVIKDAATGAAAAFVLESPLAGGALKTARKGTAVYGVEIDGRAAHAGVEPEKGISAVLELAHQVLAIHALNDWPKGTTVNVGVLRAGSRSNVIAARAEALVDVRVATTAEAKRIDRAMHGLAPKVAGAAIRLSPKPTRPPLERTALSGRLFNRARAIAEGMGVPDLGEGSTGGASDGNLTAAVGVPTLDGLGPEGAGPHAAHEHVLVESLPRRAALIAGLLAEV